MKTRMPSYHLFCLGLCFFPLLKWPSGWIVKYETRYNNYSYFGERTKNEEEKNTNTQPRMHDESKNEDNDKIKNEKEVWIRNGGTGRMHLIYMCPLKKRHQTVKGECKLHFEIGFNLKILGSF